MKQIIPLPNGSSKPINSFKDNIRPQDQEYDTGTGSRSRAKIYNIDLYASPKETVPANHSKITNLVEKWEKDLNRKAELEEARRWVADTFYDKDGNTVRNMRLHKGWSQTRLAQELGTSQSHVARIEKGTENVVIETCRKLCLALEVDMNTLNQALLNQEKMTHAKAND